MLQSREESIPASSWKCTHLHTSAEMQTTGSVKGCLLRTKHPKTTATAMRALKAVFALQNPLATSNSCSSSQQTAEMCLSCLQGDMKERKELLVFHTYSLFLQIAILITPPPGRVRVKKCTPHLGCLLCTYTSEEEWCLGGRQRWIYSQLSFFIPFLFSIVLSYILFLCVCKHKKSRTLTGTDKRHG